MKWDRENQNPLGRLTQRQEFTWFMMENFLPILLSGSRMPFLLIPSSDSDLNTFSGSPFSSPSESSFCFLFLLRFRLSFALLELSLDISDELLGEPPSSSPSSSMASSETVPAEVAIAAAYERSQSHRSDQKHLPGAARAKQLVPVISYSLDRKGWEKEEGEPASEETVARARLCPFSSWNYIVAHSNEQSEQNPVGRTLGFILLSISDKNLAAFLAPNNLFWATLKMHAKKLYHTYGPDNIKIHVYLDKD